MTTRDAILYRYIINYIESEYSIINNTPCELCGGKFNTDKFFMDEFNDTTYNTFICTCDNCGNEKEFAFSAPHLNKRSFKNNLN